MALKKVNYEKKVTRITAENLNEIQDSIIILEKEMPEAKNTAIEAKKAAEAASDEISRFLDEIRVISARTSALAALKEGSTTGDAELIDAHIDFTGKDWKNVGDHIRGISNQLSDEIALIGEGFAPVNATFEQGAYNASGTTNEQGNAIKTAFSVESSDVPVVIKNNSGNHAWLIIANNQSEDAESGWVIIEGAVPTGSETVANYYYDASIKVTGYLYYRVTERVIDSESGKLSAITPTEAALRIYCPSDNSNLIAKEVKERKEADNILLLRDRVGAMVDVAESHFNVAYAAGTNLVYQNGHGTGLFYGSPYYKYSDESDNENYVGVPVTNCSQFVTTLSKGVYYEGSRYVSGDDSENVYSEWAYYTDGTGTYPYADYDSMSASGYAKYANEKGWLQKLDVNRCNIHAGDFVFMLDSGAEDDLNNIGHVAFVLHVGRTSKTVKVLEGWNFTKPDGNKSGVREHVYDFEDIAYYAAFPIQDSLYKVKKLYETNESIISKADTRSTNVLINNTQDIVEYSTGMYTFVIDGDFDAEAIPYVSYHVDGVEGYISNKFVQCGKHYITTIHIPYNVDVVNINTLKEYDCTLNKIAVYKGYIRI